MRKYSNKLFRKLLSNKIISECERMRKFDIRASFGEECNSYDPKRDIYIYRGKESNDFIGMVKDIAFEYKSNTLYCFSKDKKYPDTFGAFMTITDGVYNDVSSETKFFDIESQRGKELCKKYNAILELKGKFLVKDNNIKR